MHEPAHFIKTFVTDLDAALGTLKPNAKLTQLQRFWLGFCLTGMLLTNSVCWAKFERASLGEYKIAALSWMFREAKVAWNYLLRTGSFMKDGGVRPNNWMKRDQAVA